MSATRLLMIGALVAITASSSGYSGIASSWSTSEHRIRAIRAAEYILRCQDFNGAIHDALDNPGINMDNNMGYAMAGLIAAYRASGDSRYIAGVRRGLEWLASVQESDGAWHWGYIAPHYHPFVSEYYRSLGIVDIKGVEAIQAYFAYNLYMYVSLSGDDAFGEQYLPFARRGIEYLLKHNYDGRFFYSSWQLRYQHWRRLPEHYSAGQGDVYLGLVALWQLTGDARYQRIASRLREGLPLFTRRNVWMTSLRNPNPYRFSNGYLPYVFRTADGLAWLTANQDGSAIAASALAIGQQANGIRADRSLTFLGEIQGVHGGVAFSSDDANPGYYYTNDTGFAILAWLGASLAPYGLELELEQRR